MVLPRYKLPSLRSVKGQALVETALLLPILMILLLGAVDFGRLFFGWVNIHQAARIGANYGATHPNMTASERDEMVLLVEGDTAALNCELDDPLPNPTFTTPAGTPTSDPSIGDFSSFSLGCEFSMITPLAGVFFGDTIDLKATATFPVRDGCVNCPTPAPATPPPTPIQCRTVPQMAGMSVQGARNAWVAAGFLAANFSPLAGQDTGTVAPNPVVTQAPLSTCVLPLAIFNSTVAVTVLPPDPVGPSCETVPNVIGLTVAAARTAWADDGFDEEEFTADGGDPDDIDNSRVVTAQATTPGSAAGVACLDLTAAIEVTTGAPLPPPPPIPCRVPNMINLRLSEGRAEWAREGFNSANLTPDGQGDFKIKSQSLVGGNYLTCDASITVSSRPNPGQ